MNGAMQGLLLGGAIILAAGAGWFAWQCWTAWRRRMRHRSVFLGEAEASSGSRAASDKDTSLSERVIAYACRTERRLSSALFRPLAPQWLRNRPWSSCSLVCAGLEGQLSPAACWESRMRLALAGAAIGAVLGILASFELGCLLALAGFIAGWQAVSRAIERRSFVRAERMERHLSEMLDVVALGMRSGMSFDRSLLLYAEHFQTLLADSFARAHRQWSCGLVPRAEALRLVAASYDSPLLHRVVENIIRSLRFGATLADNLEDAAREARAAFRSHKQEQVAKAPVKMMVPTGALILPAMLILVLGPVLLELAGGF